MYSFDPEYFTETNIADYVIEFNDNCEYNGRVSAIPWTIEDLSPMREYCAISVDKDKLLCDSCEQLRQDVYQWAIASDTDRKISDVVRFVNKQAEEIADLKDTISVLMDLLRKEQREQK